MRTVLRWLRDRLGLEAPLDAFLSHRVPAEVATGRARWMYVFGSATLAAFGVQVVTGVALAMIYVPSPQSAHASLIYLNEEVTLGWLLRGMHFFSASIMVVMVLAHMARVYLSAAYKFPREMSWVTGVVLLAVVLVMAYTGQLLRWDENGVWSVVVAAKFVARIPLIGPELAQIALGGTTVTGTTLTRFFALHVFVLPGLAFVFVGIHLWLVWHNGISEPPKSGEPVDPATYREKYRALKERGPTYWPHSAWREAVAAGAVVALSAGLAVAFGPKGPGAAPDPTVLSVDPRPDWFVTWYYALLWLKPKQLETFVMVWLPVLAFAFLLLLPIVAPAGERSPARRPWAVGAVAFLIVALGSLTWLGTMSPWVPEFETEPLTAEHVGEDPGVLSGARIFHTRGCQSCHRVLGRGGRYGPDLTDVFARMSPQEIEVWIVMGRGDMPSYRDVLAPGELDRILEFLREIERKT